MNQLVPLPALAMPVASVDDRAQLRLKHRLDAYDAAVKDHQGAIEVTADVLRVAGVNI